MFKIPFELQKKYPNKYFLTTAIFKRASVIQKVYRYAAQKAIDTAVKELLQDKLSINILTKDEFKTKKALSASARIQKNS
ncbi:MAG: DNA-directed RNA polymerase subunit omega [Candidatus Wallbacteria bacterium]|nr:DNA-directed RNA polymerase subunit omega [Candidatus Wallbacteria bacterium]